MPDRRPRILVLNQYYKPGVEATANLLADLCESLAEEFDVTVVTGRLHGRADLPSREMLNGVLVLRTRSTAFDRTKLRFRAMNYITYLVDSIVRAHSVAGADLVLCMTDPPIVGDLGLLIARRRRIPLVVISEDVFPEIATELGRLTNPLVVGPLRALVGFYLRRADTVVAIGERMRERLIAKGAPPERVIVIPNWVDIVGDHAAADGRTSGRARAGLDGRFVVMHSGNVGHAQNLDALIVATTHLRDLDGLAVPIIGFGARSRELEELTKQLGADRVRFLEYQPRECLSESLSAADIHYVGLAPGLSGYVVPSRLYGILSAGRPVIVAADEDSETAALVSRGRLWRRRAAGSARPRRGGDPRRTRRPARPRGDGGRGPGVRRSATPTACSLWVATARSSAGCSPLAHESPPGHAVLRPGVGLRRSTARDERLRLRARGAWTRGRRPHDRRARRRAAGDAARRAARRSSRAAASQPEQHTGVADEEVPAARARAPARGRGAALRRRARDRCAHLPDRCGISGNDGETNATRPFGARLPAGLDRRCAGG